MTTSRRLFLRASGPSGRYRLRDWGDLVDRWAMAAKDMLPSSGESLGRQRPENANTLTLYYYNPAMVQHETGQHPERPARVSMVARRILESGLEARLTRPAWEPVSLERLTRVHTADYIHEVERFAEHGPGRIEEDTVCGPHSYQAACLAAGAVCDAVERVVAGPDRSAFCLVRPPGHHALGSSAMGFCLFNNIAVAARTALTEFALNRVLIVDWDVHHGNGTQARQLLGR